MKNLIGLILLISFTFGQEYRTDYVVPTHINPELYEVNYFNELIARSFPRNKIVTFGNIWEYTEECYNDSTWVTVDLLFQLDDLLNIYEVYKKEVDVYYLRKKPTFKGFSKWIESRQ